MNKKMIIVTIALWFVFGCSSARHQLPEEIWLTKTGKVLQKRVEQISGEPLSKWYVVVEYLPDEAIGFCTKQLNGTCKIGISPELISPTKILSTLLHELVHVAVKKPGHGKDFENLATKLGLIGPMEATDAGPELELELNQISNNMIE